MESLTGKKGVRAWTGRDKSLEMGLLMMIFIGISPVMAYYIAYNYCPFYPCSEEFRKVRTVSEYQVHIEMQSHPT